MRRRNNYTYQWIVLRVPVVLKSVFKKVKWRIHPCFHSLCIDNWLSLCEQGPEILDSLVVVKRQARRIILSQSSRLFDKVQDVVPANALATKDRWQKCEWSS
jgi:hypothetical protein